MQSSVPRRSISRTYAALAVSSSPARTGARSAHVQHLQVARLVRSDGRGGRAFAGDGRRCRARVRASRAARGRRALRAARQWMRREREREIVRADARGLAGAHDDHGERSVSRARAGRRAAGLERALVAQVDVGLVAQPAQPQLALFLGLARANLSARSPRASSRRSCRASVARAPRPCASRSATVSVR